MVEMIAPEEPHYLLGAGDIYDMQTRQAVSYANVRRRPSTSEPAGFCRTPVQTKYDLRACRTGAAPFDANSEGQR